MRRHLPALLLTAATAAAVSAAVPTARAAEPVALSVLVPITGFLALEGTAQRNGAVLALDHPPAGVQVSYEVTDTATSPEQAVTALERALGRGAPVAAAAPIFGTPVLAMLPVPPPAGRGGAFQSLWRWRLWPTSRTGGRTSRPPWPMCGRSSMPGHRKSMSCCPTATSTPRPPCWRRCAVRPAACA